MNVRVDLFDRQEDATGNSAVVSGRRRQAPEGRRADLIRIEATERFEGLQRFFATVHRLTTRRLLSRIAYVVEKDA